MDTETRCNYTISAEIKKLWNLQLNMLNYLMEVCKRNNLKVFASSGTVLGAVRHQGYIPWDDDIDVDMLREDYDKLVQIADREFKAPYFLQCAYTDKGYYRGHAQLRFTGTAQILYPDVYHDFDQSIFIDIFILDSIPDDPAQRQQVLEQADVLKTFLWNRHYTYEFFLHPLQWLRNRNTCKKMGFDIKASDHDLFKTYEDLFRNPAYKSSKQIGYIAYNTKSIRKAMDRTWYKEFKTVKFENMEISIPVHHHEVLTSLFGPDYMTPMQCATCHGDFYLDLEHSYKEHLKRLRQPLWLYVLLFNLKRPLRPLKKLWQKH